MKLQKYNLWEIDYRQPGEPGMPGYFLRSERWFPSKTYWCAQVIRIVYAVDKGRAILGLKQLGSIAREDT